MNISFGDTGDPDFYRAVAPSVVLVPISIAGDRSMRSDLYISKPARQWNLEVAAAADTVHKAFMGDFEIEI